LAVRSRGARSLALGAALGLGLLTGCGGGRQRLLLVTTDDLQGKTSPCGCHTPKGGLARLAAFLDSLRASGRDVLALDAGGFFPVTDDERDAGPFVLDAMSRMGTRAAGVGPGELRFGYTYVREAARAAGLPLLCANLERTADTGGGPAFERWRLLRAGATAVGVFGLMPEGTDLGPARDSLVASSPEAAARTAVDSLRAAGAEVIVLLSQLGRAPGESLATHVPGIDVVVGGGGVPALADGFGVGGAIAIYGGMQGWQVGLAEVPAVPRGRARRILAHTVVLGPWVKGDPPMAARVKAFEDSLNAALRAREAAYGPRSRQGLPAAHYVGMANCTKCHAGEYTQWLTTSHSRAWSTLVTQRKEATPACVPCHVTGLGRPGGFRTADDAARFGNVQCEACHGMGTNHRAWEERPEPVSEATCRGCHTGTTSPTFRFALYRAHVLHNPPPGLRPLPPSPAQQLMKAGGAPHGR